MSTIQKAKSAFLYYQGDQLAKIRTELGVSMGDAMTEVSWLATFISSIAAVMRNTVELIR